MYKIVFLIVICFLLKINPCISKQTSDIINGTTYTNDSSTYLILHELIFHPTSKSYEQGNFRSTGYNESCISIYDMRNGNRIAQKNFGTLDNNNAIVLLACVDEKIYIYSNNENNGILVFDMFSFDKKTTFTSYMINRDFAQQFIKTDWAKMINHFGFNGFTNELIFTDTLNKKYACNINKYEVKTSNLKTNTIKRTNFYQQTFNYDGNTLSFSRGDMQCLMLNDTKINDNFCFLDGYIIMDQNPIDQFNYLFNNKNNLIEQQSDKFNKAKILEQAQNPHYRVVQKQVDSLNALIATNTTKLANLLNGQLSTEIALRDKLNHFYIAHKNNENNDALLSISKIEIENGNIFFKPWTVTIPGMYYNLAEASNTEGFKRLFPTGYPESDYLQYELIDDNLLVIYLLQMCLIDINTGKIIWRAKL